MKKVQGLIIVLAVIAAGAFTSASAQSVSGPASNDGDLFIGFRESGAAGDLLTDLGNVSAFVGLAPGTVLTLNTNTYSGSNGSTNAIGGLGADLNTTFGSTWFSNSNVLWAAIGGVQFAGDGAGADTANTLYSSKQVQSPTWTRLTSGAQATGISDYNGISNFYSSSLNSTTTHSNWNEIQTASSVNSYAYFQPGGAGVSSQGNISFGTFSPSNEVAGVSNKIWLDEIFPSSTGGSSTLLGFFSLDSTGSLTFTAGATAVPEPSVMSLLAILGLGALGALAYARRRRLLARE